MSLFSRKVRGFRLVEVIGVSLLIATVLAVYLGKTLAGKERNQIAAVEKEIAGEEEKVRLLRAEVSYLEQPERLERLSTAYLGLQPIHAKQEMAPEALLTLAHAPAAAPASAASAAPASPAPAAAAPATEAGHDTEEAPKKTGVTTP